MSVVLGLVMFFTTSVFGSPALEELFVDDLRFKSCQISLQVDDDGYEIYVRRDCPSSKCSQRLLGGHINEKTR